MKYIWDWFVSAEKGVQRKSVYIGLSGLLAILAYFAIDSAGFGPFPIALGIAFLLIAVVLVSLLITNVIVLKITMVKQNKKAEHEAKQAEEADDEDL